MGPFGGNWQGGWPVANESRDGKGDGDHDQPYTWGHPCAYLSIVQQGWLTIMRGYVLDYRAGIRGGAADGDSEDVTQTDSGLWVAK